MFCCQLPWRDSKRGMHGIVVAVLLAGSPLMSQSAPAMQAADAGKVSRAAEADSKQSSAEAQAVESELGGAGDTELADSQAETTSRPSRAAMLVGSLTVFLLAVFVGFEVITKVPPTLHTPLMSGSNAISGITIVGAMLTAGAAGLSLGSWLGMVAVVLAAINVVGGFLVTHRMLMMFKKK